MKKRYDALSVIGSFPLDCVQRRDNGGTCFDLKMTISENRAPHFGAYVVIETGKRGVGLLLTRAYGRSALRFPLVDDCTIPPDSSIREGALLFCRAMLNESFSPMYDQKNKVVE